MSFFLARLKAAAAVLVAGLGPLLIKTAEAGTGFDIPATWEAWLIAFLAGIAVNYTTNKTA